MWVELLGVVGAVVLLTFAYGIGQREGAEAVRRDRCPQCGHPGHYARRGAYTALCVHCPRQEPTYWQSEWNRHGCPCRHPEGNRPPRPDGT
jgi:hypothetical protein